MPDTTITNDNVLDASLKPAFAKAMLRYPGRPIEAASQVCGQDWNILLVMAHEWSEDEEVHRLMRELGETEGWDKNLPTRAEIAYDVWMRAKEAKNTSEYTKLVELHCSMRPGFIERPVQPGITNNTIFANKVVEVLSHGSDAEWEKQAEKQQQELVSGAKTIDAKLIQ